jgi:hypothetical protein
MITELPTADYSQGEGRGTGTHENVSDAANFLFLRLGSSFMATAMIFLI